MSIAALFCFPIFSSHNTSNRSSNTYISIFSSCIFNTFSKPLRTHKPSSFSSSKHLKTLHFETNNPSINISSSNKNSIPDLSFLSYPTPSTSTCNNNSVQYPKPDISSSSECTPSTNVSNNNYVQSPESDSSFSAPLTPSAKSSSCIQSPKPDFSFLAESFPWGNDKTKMPTAPWMSGPLLLPADEVLDLSKIRKKKSSGKAEEDEKKDQSLTDKVSGGRGRKAMRKIIESITKLQEIHDSDDKVSKIEGYELHVPLERVEDKRNSTLAGRMPWAMDDKIVFRRTKKEKIVLAAELWLPKMLLDRLRSDAVKMTKWVKVKKAGVTQAVVDEVKLLWKRNELVMVKFDVPLCRNMDRAQEILEMKTGGLVVWSKKDTVVIYRGALGLFGEISSSKISPQKSEGMITSSQVEVSETTMEGSVDGKDEEDGSLPTKLNMEQNVGDQSINRSLYEREVDRLLDGLGPRYIDWWRPKPLPVDADLLPEIVSGFRPPFRLCPPHVMPKLKDDELTFLRNLARSLPTHFVLGRNKKLQGLAAAILKLWENSLIVKIAVKLGIPNTNNELMAWELKCLTGGVLILRNKFYISLYRGKDFLPVRVGNVVAVREMELKRYQLQEEGARLKAIESLNVTGEALSSTSSIGSLSEFQDIQTMCVNERNRSQNFDVQLEAENEKLEKELRKQEQKLLILNLKIERSGKKLSKLNSAWRPSKHDTDQEMINEEERQCFRNIGLQMGRALVLGRRGVFDGVIGGLHQHWKHREVVKVITMQRVFSEVTDTAKLLEIESGGLLVSVDRLKKGYAIILYRGKNYRRPLKLVPENLLNKRAALQRSIEMQRIGSLQFFLHQRQRTISDLKLKLGIHRKEIRK